MAFMKPVMNTVSKDIKDVSIYLRSVKKWGKSTLFRDVIRQKYNDLTKGCLVECGMECGDSMLNMNGTHLNTYAEFKEFKDWLISTKGKEHNIEIVCFDTADEMIPVFEVETIRINNRDNPQKPVKSIKAAMGGYNAGIDYTASLIKKYIAEIKQAGFGVWVIAHTKFKTIREKGGLEEDGYMQLTSNLVNAYESAFGDIFDCTLTGVIDRAFDEKTKDNKTKKYTTDSIRKLYFRGTTLIDAGGRFASDTVPEYMEYDCNSVEFADKFINTVESALNGSAIDVPTPTVKPTITQPEPIEEDIDDVPFEVDEDSVDIDIEALRDEVRTKFKSADAETKAKVKSILNGVKVNDADVDVLMEVIKEF